MAEEFTAGIPATAEELGMFASIKPFNAGGTKLTARMYLSYVKLSESGKNVIATLKLEDSDSIVRVQVLEEAKPETVIVNEQGQNETIPSTLEALTGRVGARVVNPTFAIVETANEDGVMAPTVPERVETEGGDRIYVYAYLLDADAYEQAPKIKSTLSTGLAALETAS